MSRDKYAPFIGAILGLLIQIVFCRNFSISANIFNDLLTLFSIVIGFYVTSFAIFASSSYVASLYWVVDSSNKSQTLLHELVGRYKLGLLLSLITVTYIVGVEMFYSGMDMDKIKLHDVLVIPLFALVIANIWTCYTMVTYLSQVVIQQARKTSKRKL